MEEMLIYIIKLCQANLILGFVFIVGIFVVLMCLAAVDRKIGYLKKEVDLLLDHEGIKIPEPAPRKGKKGKKAEATEAEEQK